MRVTRTAGLRLAACALSLLVSQACGGAESWEEEHPTPAPSASERQARSSAPIGVDGTSAEVQAAYGAGDVDNNLGVCPPPEEETGTLNGGT